MRNPKVKATVVNEPLPTRDEEQTAFRSMFDKLSMTLPTGKRILIALVANVFVVLAGSYMGRQVSAMLMIGALALTGSAFIAFVSSFMLLAIAFIASIVAGGKLQSFILLGGVDALYEKTKHRVTTLFGSREGVTS